MDSINPFPLIPSSQDVNVLSVVVAIPISLPKSNNYGCEHFFGLMPIQKIRLKKYICA